MQAIFEVIDAMPDARFAALMLAICAAVLVAAHLAAWLVKGRE